MTFPFTYTNKVEVQFDEKKHTPENLLDSVIKSLQKAKAKNVKNNLNHITFTGGIFRLVTNWNILGSISSGEITIERNKDKLCLKYHLKFTEMLIIVTVGVFGFLGIGIYQASNLTNIHKIIMLIIAWLWLFGGNYMVTIFRFPKFINEMTEIE